MPDVLHRNHCSTVRLAQVMEAPGAPVEPGALAELVAPEAMAGNFW